jgi:hypothetical protein
MTGLFLLFMVVGYWSVAVAILALSASGATEYPLIETVSVAVAWPIFIMVYVPYLIWRSLFKAAASIRIDLDNRNLLREFDAWLTEREANRGDEIK